MSGKIQNEDIKSLAELTGAGGSASQLPNDTKIYVTANGINKQLSQAITDGDIGGGGEGVNYMPNPEPSSTTGPFATYNDASGAVPIDGTGGTSGSTSTIVSSALFDKGYAYFSEKGGGSAQGTGYSKSFTISPLDRDKVSVLQIKFDYRIVATPGDYPDNDLTVWVYSIDDSKLIPVAPNGLQGIGLGFVGTFFGEFQVSKNSLNYRLILHYSKTNAYDMDFYWGNFSVGPQAKLYGSPITDWETYSASLVGITIGNGAATLFRKQVGDTIKIKGSIGIGSTTSTSGILGVTLPSGLAADFSKMEGNAGNIGGGNVRIGVASAYDQSTGTTYTADLYLDNSSILRFFGPNGGWTNTYPISWTTNDEIHIMPSNEIPIQGWSSSQIMSHDANTRVVAANVAASTATNLVANTDVTISFQTILDDTHVAWNTSTNEYTVKIPGRYKIRPNLLLNVSAFTSATYVDTYILVNGVKVGSSRTIVREVAFISVTPPEYLGNLKANDVIKIQVQQIGNAMTGQVWGDTGFSSLIIDLLNGPSQIMASENVTASYTSATVQSFLSGTFSTFKYDTKVWDSHNAMNTSNGKFTAPIAGEYEIIAINLFDIYAWSAGTFYGQILLKNGSTNYGYINHERFLAGGTSYVGPSTAAPIRIMLLAGETVEVQIINDRGTVGVTTTNTIADHTLQRIQIRRVGNYA